MDAEIAFDLYVIGRITLAGIFFWAGINLIAFGRYFYLKDR